MFSLIWIYNEKLYFKSNCCPLTNRCMGPSPVSLHPGRNPVITTEICAGLYQVTVMIIPYTL